MQLIPIAPDILINPDKISIVEKMNIKGKESLVIVVDGVRKVVTMNIDDVYRKLVESGVDKQFWAG